MGSGSTKAHEASAVAPAPAVTSAGEEIASTASPVSAIADTFMPSGNLSIVGVEAAKFTTEHGQNLDPEEAAELAAKIQAIAVAKVASASQDQLMAAAEEAGLPMAKVIAESDFAQEPAVEAAVAQFLVTQDVNQQLAVHAAMVALANNEGVPPEWVADLDKLDGDETWTGPLTDFHEAIAAHEAGANSKDLNERVDNINKVWGYVPEDPELEAMVAWARTKTTINPHGGYGSTLDHDALPDSVSDLDKKFLNQTDLLHLGAMSTPMQTRIALKAKAQLASDVAGVITDADLNTCWETLPGDIGELKKWTLKNQTIGNAMSSISKQYTVLAHVKNATGIGHPPEKVTQSFRTWAKTEKLAELRAVAVELGLQNANKASRAQVQNYIASHWDSSDKTNKSKIQAAVDLKANPAPKPTATSTTAASASTTSAPLKPQAAKAKPSQTMAATPVGSSSRFHSNVISLASKAATAANLATDLPSPTASSAVAAHDWESNKIGGFSKGSHESALYQGPGDSGQWMFKPDKSNKGARAEAEAAASKVFAAAGVPTVDVHVAKVGAKTGAVQPMVKGAQNFSGSPSTWSQADVDQIVSHHVASWAVGDHDGHSANILRTPSGALVGIDHGQAFKFTGSDKLTTSWKPSGNPSPTVHSQLYSAAKSGGLAPGVEVKASAALPAIKKLQAIPDDTYRSWLSETATQGVKHGVHWVPAMRKAAQKRHGTSSVTDSQIAGEFLTTMTERKNNLATAFSGLFAKEGFTGAQHIPMLASSAA